MKNTFQRSGLYLVTLNNSELISVNANDPRRVSTAIKVNKFNCKFGKARDLSVRERNYQKVFGSHNVNFIPLALLHEIDLAEKIILNELDRYRIRGVTGQKNEWLHNINHIDVICMVYGQLIDKCIEFKFV